MCEVTLAGDVTPSRSSPCSFIFSLSLAAASSYNSRAYLPCTVHPVCSRCAMRCCAEPRRSKREGRQGIQGSRTVLSSAQQAQRSLAFFSSFTSPSACGCWDKRNTFPSLTAVSRRLSQAAGRGRKRRKKACNHAFLHVLPTTLSLWLRSVSSCASLRLPLSLSRSLLSEHSRPFVSPLTLSGAG